MAEIYFSTIGKVLTEMLRDDSHFKEHIDRIKNLLNSQVYQEATKQAEAENDPYQNLEAATDGLYDLLRRPLKRKRTRDFASTDSTPRKRSRSLAGNLKAMHNEENYNSCVDSPSQEEYESSSEEEHIDSSPDHEKSRNSAVERNEPETETIGQVMNPEHKIILSSIVFRRTVVEKADYSETEAEDSQIEDDSDEDSQLEDDSDEDSQLEDDSDEDSQLEDVSDEDSQLGDDPDEDDPAEDSRIEDDSDEDSWIEGLNNDCVLRSEFAEKHLRTTIKCLKSQRQYRPLSIACYLSTDSNHLQSDLARLADTEFPGGFQEVTAGDYFEETELELS
ncbi:hypothetical protein TrVFT333_000629 [Trichoderma virens FT-333]|nr:hypothetical protein TrVFT333_000629 [Trichoderma virens FT-333]